MSKNRFIKMFFIQALVLLLAAGLLVVIFDPFYHYHKPIGSMKAVVTKSEHQCIGTIRHFDYDAIIMGSSIAENYNNHWFDEAFGGTTIKGIKSGGTTVELLYYLKEAFEAKERKGQKLNNVYYCLDMTALESDPEEVFPTEDFPLYLFNNNPFDDVQYIWNKDVIFESIPYLIATNLQGDYDEGLSYSWAEGKTFATEMAMKYYARPEQIAEQKPAEEGMDWVSRNLDMIKEQVEAHPETTFRFIMSPFSILWWDEAYRDGSLNHRLYAMEYAISELLPYDNCEIYFYMDQEEIVTNLDNYMDNIHFSQDINHYVVEQMALGKGRLTEENYRQTLAHMLEIVERAEDTLLPQLYGE